MSCNKSSCCGGSACKKKVYDDNGRELRQLITTKNDGDTKTVIVLRYKYDEKTGEQDFYEKFVSVNDVATGTRVTNMYEIEWKPVEERRRTIPIDKVSAHLRPDGWVCTASEIKADVNNTATTTITTVAEGAAAAATTTTNNVSEAKACSCKCKTSTDKNKTDIDVSKNTTDAANVTGASSNVPIVENKEPVSL